MLQSIGLANKWAANSITFNPQGTVLASRGIDNTVKLWNTSDGSLLLSIDVAHNWALNCVSFSPDGATLASCGADGNINLWNVSDASFSKSVRCAHTDGVNAISFSPDGARIASCGFGKVKLWNVADATFTHAHTSIRKKGQNIALVNFSPNGHLLADFSETLQSITISEASNLAILRSVDVLQHTKAVYALTFSPDSTTLASGGEDRSIKLWNVFDGSLLNSFNDAHQSAVFSLSFSPDGAILASGSEHDIKLWNVHEDTLLTIQEARQQCITSCALNTHSDFVASCSGNTVCVHSVSTGKSLMKVTGDVGP